MLNNIYCPNENCKFYGIPNAGNLKVKQTQGKVEDIALVKCKECNTKFSERKGTVYFNIKKPAHVFDEVIALSMTRISMLDITRVTGVSEDTIHRWIKKAAKYLSFFQDRLVKDLDIKECQIDEMWSFVLMKKKTADLQEKKNDIDIGDQWIFIAIDAVSKLVIHWSVGKRTLKVAKEFIKVVKSKIKTSPLFTTDEWRGYEQAFLANFSKINPPKRSKKRGRPRKKMILKVDPKLKLAQTHKHRKNGKVVEVSTKIIFGFSEEIKEILSNSPVSNEINTSIVERHNGTVRSKVSRVVRDCYSFSKKLEMHKAHLTIFFVYYNFIWVHSRLKKTASVLSGIVDKAFTFRDLFELRKVEFICGD